MGTAGRTGPSWDSWTIRGTDGRTDRRTDGWTDGWTDERTNERYGEIRSRTVGGPSRLASIHSPPNSLDLGISFSSRTLSSSHRSGSSLPRFPSTSRFQHPSTSSLTQSRLSQLLSRVSSHSLALTPFPLLFFSSAFFSSHLRRILFSSSFSHYDPPSPLRHPNIPFHRPSFRCRTGTRNSSSLPTHGFDYSQLRQKP